MTAAPQSCQPILERLRSMPSSLNDACRTMEEAAGVIEGLEEVLRRMIADIRASMSKQEPGA